MLKSRAQELKKLAKLKENQKKLRRSKNIEVNITINVYSK